jgi:hypothetical protein
MDEQTARDVVLVRAIETTDASAAIFTADDRRYASRAAGELARWQAAEQRTAATAELFLAKRAALALDKLSARAPALRGLRKVRWRPWIGLALPVAALALGALTEHIADRQHINVLAFPLLGILAWNVAVYLFLILRPFLGSTLGPLRRWITGAARFPRTPPNEVTAATAVRFASDWTDLSRSLLDARAGRVLHLSAALFALGALLGLYVRAVAFEYRIGWESTFLQPAAVHAFLAALLGPAANLLGMTFPSIEAIEAMRITGGVGGTNAGPWIHLYAVTVGIAVVLPRLALFAWAAWRERVLARAFRFDLGTPYFRRVLASFAPSSARVRVIPYSYTLDESVVAGLNGLARHLLGDATQLALRPSVEFGAETSAANGLARREDDVPLTLAIFNAAATPENENHGLFLDTLKSALDTPLAVVVDSAPFRRRLGGQSGANERVDERCHAWQGFAAQRGLPVACIDFTAPELGRAETDLAAALAGTQ